MSVWCRQSIDGEASEPYMIAPVDPADTDADLLERKAKGAADKGWTVERTSPSSFTATKVRWQSSGTCVREFWID